MRRDKGNAPVVNPNSGGGGGSADNIAESVSDLDNKTAPFVLVVDEDGATTYERNSDGTYTAIASVGGEHTIVNLGDITVSEVDAMWEN